MRALLLDEGLHVVNDHPTPEPPPGEALIRVRVTGVCNTDLELVKGYMHFHGVPGHEFVGVVERAPGAEKWEGVRVVGDINAACETCPTCQAGRPTHCPHRTTLGIAGRDGAFAEYLTLPTRNLHIVPDALPDDVAVFAEPLAAACEILEQIHLHPTDRVVTMRMLPPMPMSSSRQRGSPWVTLPRADWYVHVAQSCLNPRIMAQSRPLSRRSSWTRSSWLARAADRSHRRCAS